MNGASRVAVTLVWCLIVSVAAVGGLGPASSADEVAPSEAEHRLPEEAPPWSHDPNAQLAEGDIEARMELERVDRDEAIRRYRVEHAAAELQVKAEQRWPRTFGGLWIERDPFAVSIAFTEHAEAAVSRLREEFPYPSDLRAEHARLSYSELEQLQSKMAADRGAIEVGATANQLPASMRATGGRYDLSLDVPNGSVKVRVDHVTPQLRADLRSRYGPEIEVSEGRAMPTTCRIVACDPAIMGGLEMRRGDGNRCSTAFVARWRPNNARTVLSAGHCSRVGNNVYGDVGRRHNWIHLGNVSYIEHHRRWDAERIAVTSAWKESSKFFVENQNPRMLHNWMRWQNIPIGALIGKTGWNTGTTLGWVLEKNYLPSSSVIPNPEPRWVLATFCVGQGDSGGAVWQHHTALGIVSLALLQSCDGNQPRPGTIGGKGIFGSIEYAQDALNVWLPAGVNIPPVARFTSSCQVNLINLNQTCTLRGGSSVDYDGSIVSYSWRFSNGGTKSGATVTHTFPWLGNHWARLTVTDNDGSTHSLQKNI